MAWTTSKIRPYRNSIYPHYACYPFGLILSYTDKPCLSRHLNSSFSVSFPLCLYGLKPLYLIYSLYDYQDRRSYYQSILKFSLINYLLPNLVLIRLIQSSLDKSGLTKTSYIKSSCISFIFGPGPI